MVKIDLTEHEGFPPHAILTSTFETDYWIEDIEGDGF